LFYLFNNVHREASLGFFRHRSGNI